MSIVSVCGEVTLKDANEPVEIAEPLTIPKLPLPITPCQEPLIPAAVKSLSSLVTLEAIEDEKSNKLGTVIPAILTAPNEPVDIAEPLTIPRLPLPITPCQEPLIVVLAVDPNEESHTPVAIVPTEVMLVCAAVAKVPLTVEASTLPNEAVEVDEPLTLPELVKCILPVNEWISSEVSPNLVEPLA